MPRYLLLALNGPTTGEGDEAAFNTWYDDIHLPDLKAIEGVRSARRYKVIDNKLPPGVAAWPYLAAYEIETDDLNAVYKAMSTSMRPFSPTFDRALSASFTAIEI